MSSDSCSNGVIVRNLMSDGVKFDGVTMRILFFRVQNCSIVSKADLAAAPDNGMVRMVPPVPSSGSGPSSFSSRSLICSICSTVPRTHNCMVTASPSTIGPWADDFAASFLSPVAEVSPKNLLIAITANCGSTRFNGITSNCNS